MMCIPFEVALFAGSTSGVWSSGSSRLASNASGVSSFLDGTAFLVVEPLLNLSLKLPRLLRLDSSGEVLWISWFEVITSRF